MSTPLEPISNAGGSVASENLLSKRSRLRWALREDPVEPVDNGWRFLSAIDDDDYINDPRHMIVCDFNSVIEIEPAVRALFGAPTGSEFEFIADPDGSSRFVDGRTGATVNIPKPQA